MRCSYCNSPKDFCPSCDFQKEQDTAQALLEDNPSCLFDSRPDLLKNLAILGQVGSSAEITKVLPLLSRLSSSALSEMHVDTVYEIAKMVSLLSRSASALDLLSFVLRKITVSDLLQMHPATIIQLCRAATLGSPRALNAIAGGCLGALNYRELSLLDPQTLSFIAEAAIAGYPSALTSIADNVLIDPEFNFSVTAVISHDTLNMFAQAAINGHGRALDNASCWINNLLANDLSDMHPMTLYHLARASSSGYPRALCAITPVLHNLSASMLNAMDERTIPAVVLAAQYSRNDGAITNLMNAFDELSLDDQLNLDPSGSLHQAYNSLSTYSTPLASSFGSSNSLSIFSHASSQHLGELISSGCEGMRDSFDSLSHTP